MSRRLKKLVTVFELSEDNRERLTLGPNVRLNPKTNKVHLQAGADGKYPTATGLYFKTWLANPKSVKAWLLFQANSENKKNFHNTVVTSIGYRLSVDGAAQLYWDGGAWTAATTQWNTEAEVAANIAALPVANRSIQVIANLLTTDPEQTPEVSALKVLWECDIEFQEDYIFRSLLPSLRAGVRPISEAVLPANGTATLSLAGIETPYNIIAVDSAYNLASDPNQLTDLASGYNPGTKALTLSASQASGNILVRFTYAPEIAVTTHQEYIELGKVPAVLIEIQQVGSKEMAEHESVIDKATGAGWQLAGGSMQDLDIRMRLITDKEKDLQRLSDEMKRWFSSNQLLRSVGQDELYRLALLDEYSQGAEPDQSEVHTARLRGRLINAVFYAQDAIPVTGVLSFQVAGGNLTFQV